MLYTYTPMLWESNCRLLSVLCEYSTVQYSTVQNSTPAIFEFSYASRLDFAQLVRGGGIQSSMTVNCCGIQIIDEVVESLRGGGCASCPTSCMCCRVIVDG